MLAQQDGDISNKGDEADDASNNVLFAVQEGLAGSIQFCVVCNVVVALGEEPEGCLAVGIISTCSQSRRIRVPSSHFAVRLGPRIQNRRLTLLHIA